MQAESKLIAVTVACVFVLHFHILDGTTVNFPLSSCQIVQKDACLEHEHVFLHTAEKGMS
jgi:hypothetical protein